MAVNTDIYSQFAPAATPVESPLAAMAKASAVQDARLNAQDRMRSAQEDAQIRQALQQSGGDLEKALPQISTISAPKAIAIQKSLNDTRKVNHELALSQLDMQQKFAEFTSQQMQGVQELPEDQRPSAYLHSVASINAVRHSIGLPPADEMSPQYDDAAVKSYIAKGVSFKDKIQQAREERMAAFQQAESKRADERADLAGKREERMAAAQQTQLGLEQKRVGLEGQRVALEGKRLAQGGAQGSSGGKSDVQEAVAGMKDGTIPPQLPGRASKDYSAVMAEAHRQGFDLTKAVEDWTATQKYLGTLNGNQQTRLRQAVKQVEESVPLVRNLVKEWDSAGIPVLSAANLKAAMAGTYGNNAQSLARRLDAQIADMTSELGTVYKGGNSSTDESLKLAAKNLGADWSKKAALDALDQIEKNLQYRRNSMKLGPVTSGENRYAPDLSGTPAGVSSLLGSQKPGKYTLSDGSKWIKAQDGTISQAQ